MQMQMEKKKPSMTGTCTNSINMDNVLTPLLVRLALLECDALHCTFVSGLVCLVEPLLELDLTRLARCERGRVAELLDIERV